MKHTRSLSLLCLFLLSYSLQLEANSIRTYRSIVGAWVTEAVVDARGWRDPALKAIVDLAKYRYWALAGMDGRDPVSAPYWEHFTDFIFRAPSVMVLVYDINLGWPLGSTGNQMPFAVDQAALARGELHLSNLDKPVGIEEVHLRIRARQSQSEPVDEIQIELSIRYGWLLDALMDMKGYTAHMNEVLTTLSNNLKRYCEPPPIME